MSTFSRRVLAPIATLFVVAIAGLLLTSLFVSSSTRAMDLIVDKVDDCEEQYIVWTPDPTKPNVRNGLTTDKIARALCLLEDPFNYGHYSGWGELVSVLDEAQSRQDPAALLARYGTSIEEVEEVIDQMKVRDAQHDYGQFYWDLKLYGSADPDLGWTLEQIYQTYIDAVRGELPEVPYSEMYQMTTPAEFAAFDQKMGFTPPTTIADALSCAGHNQLYPQVIVDEVVAECKLDQLPPPTWK